MKGESAGREDHQSMLHPGGGNRRQDANTDALGPHADGGLDAGGEMTTRTPYASITITRRYGDSYPEAHLHGNLPAHLIDQGLDDAKRQLGTYEETPLDLFLEENGLVVHIVALGETHLRASLEASLRDPGNCWRLLRAAGEGGTPAAARRALTRRISGGTLVTGSGLPISRDIPVPDLTPQQEDDPDGATEKATG